MQGRPKGNGQRECSTEGQNQRPKRTLVGNDQTRRQRQRPNRSNKESPKQRPKRSIAENATTGGLNAGKAKGQWPKRMQHRRPKPKAKENASRE